jgi:hypothetical protein
VRGVSLAAVVVLGALVFAASAQACSCARTPLAGAMGEADAAIVGSLVEVVPRGGPQADFRYRMHRVYKSGEGLRRGAVVSVRATTSSAACGLPAQIGRSYGLLLTRAEGRWRGALCGVVNPDQLDARRGASPSCST